MTLATIPTELLDAVWQHIDSEKDMNAVVQTCRRVYSLLNKYLYHHTIQHTCVRTMKWAAGRGRVSTLQHMLDGGADLVGDPTRSPIFHAAQIGHPEVIRWALEQGADIEMKEKYGESTALRKAAAYGQEGVVNLLLEHGADIEARDIHGSTPLLAAAECGFSTVTTLLLEKGACPNAVDHLSRSALWYAAGSCTPRTVEAILTRCSPDLLSVTDSQHHSTPLTRAAYLNQVGKIRLLLAAGSQMDTPGHPDDSALRMAIKGDAHDALCLLLDEGASPNDTESQTSPLFLAVCQHSSAMVATLLQRGADPNYIWTASGQSCLSAACKNDEDTNIPLQLLDAGANVNHPSSGFYHPLLAALHSGAVSTAEHLLRQGANPNPGYGHLTPLHWAARCGNADLIRLLIEKGADIEAETPFDLTPLVVAAMNGEVDAIRPLLAAGADPYATGWGGQTALSLAAERGFADVIIALLDDGTDPESWTYPSHPLPEDGETPCPSGAHIRSGRGRALDTPDTPNRTPLFYGTVNGHISVVEVLLSRGSNAITTLTRAHRSAKSVTDACLTREVWANDFPLHRISSVLSHPEKAKVTMRAVKATSDRMRRECIEESTDYIDGPVDRYSCDQFWCDGCSGRMYEFDTRWNCPECEGGNYDLCAECHASRSCNDETHVLVEMVIVEGEDWGRVNDTSNSNEEGEEDDP